MHTRWVKSFRSICQTFIQNTKHFLNTFLTFFSLLITRQGVIYLHESPIRFHGSLCTSNCLVDSRWVVKLTDFGLFAFKKGMEDNSTEVPNMTVKCTSMCRH